MKTTIFILSLIVSGAAVAQSPTRDATRDIAHLISALRDSKCEFFRNGTWHNPQQAAKHLHRKYDYLTKQGLITTAESFIELAATQSSMSGKPYLVRCRDKQPVPSKLWFTGQLEELRARSIGADELPTPDIRRQPNTASES